jgi:Mn-containing catalase
VQGEVGHDLTQPQRGERRERLVLERVLELMDDQEVEEPSQLQRAVRFRVRALETRIGREG